MTTPAATPSPTEQLARATTATGQLIAAIRDDQWSAATPCSDWTVRDLLNHLVGGTLAFAAVLTEQPPPERAADHLGADPIEAYRQAAAVLQAALHQPGILDRVVTLPPDRRPFAPPQPMPEDASGIERLVATVGRTVSADSAEGDASG